MKSPLFTIALTAFLAAAAAAHAEEIVTLPTRDGVNQSFLLTVPADGKPAAVAILLPGGGGNINLRAKGGRLAFSPGNFLVRTRDEFARRGIAAAVVDAPSDQSSGMSDGFRSGSDHARDIGLVLADVKKRFPGLAVYLAGTSRGTVSAAYVGRAMGTDVAGVVLTSSVYLATGGRRGGGQAGLSGFDFADIKAPVLLVHHAEDGCNNTPYREARKLADARQYPLITVNDGNPPTSGPCDPFSAHGYLGKEPATVEAMVNWMLKKPYPTNIE